MQNSVNTFSWVNPNSFTKATTTKSQWHDYPNLTPSIPDFFLKKNSNIYSSTFSQLAAHSNYLEKMNNLSVAVNSTTNELNSQFSPSQLNNHPISDLNDKCPHLKNKYSCDLCMQQYSLSLNNKDFKNLQNNLDSDQLSHQALNSSSNHLAILSDSGLNSDSLFKKNLMNSTNNTLNQHHDNINSLAINGNNLHLSLASTNQNNTLNSNASNALVSSLSNGLNSKNFIAIKGSFLCTVCNKTFTQKGNLKTHTLIHMGQKPFSCEICGKSFTQKGNLDTHSKIHSGEKKNKKIIKSRDIIYKDKFLNCGLCSKSFNHRANLSAHLKTHNKEEFLTDDFKSQIYRQKEIENSKNLIGSNQQDLNNAALISNHLNQNQNVMNRLLPMSSSIMNTFGLIDEQNNSLLSSKNHHSTFNISPTSSAQLHYNTLNGNSNQLNELNEHNSMNFNTSNLQLNHTSNLWNITPNCKTNTNTSLNPTNFQTNNYDNFANLAGYNTINNQQSHLNNSTLNSNENLARLQLLEQLNQNGKNSPIQNISMHPHQNQTQLSQINNSCYSGVNFQQLLQ